MITQALIGLRADLRIVDLAARAIREEIAHSAIYLALARAYAMNDVPAPRPEPVDAPVYPGVGDDGQRLLQVVGMCSINETMACSFLELCLEGATAAPVRAGLRAVLEDEIRHARIGWAYLGSPDIGDAERRLVSDGLTPMLRAQWRGWLDQLATLPQGERIDMDVLPPPRSSKPRERRCAIWCSLASPRRGLTPRTRSGGSSRTARSARDAASARS